MAIILALLAILAGIMAFVAAGAIFTTAVMAFAVMIIFQIIPKLAGLALGLTINAIRAAAVLTLFGFREMTGHAARGLAPRQSEPNGQSKARARSDAEQSIPQINSWKAACTILGLPRDGFTKAELTRAYRTAIVTAHPDVGGNPRLAQAVNVARDLIRTQQGWT